jgi:flagella basal body P-ring formation protein FlgA
MRKPSKIGSRYLKWSNCHSFSITRLGIAIGFCLSANLNLTATSTLPNGTADKPIASEQKSGAKVVGTTPAITVAQMPKAPPTTLSAEAIKIAIDRYVSDAISHEVLPVGQTIDYKIEQLDDRLALTPCTTPLAIKPYHQQGRGLLGRITLQVTCMEPKPWRLFIPVRFKRFDRVVTTAAPLPRRTALDATLLSYKQQDVSTLPGGYYRNIKQVVGYETKQFVQQGQILGPHHLTPPKLVHRQQEVTIVSRSKRVSVKATGIALSDGRKGDRIKVRNKKSQRIIEAKVGSAGTVYATY